MARDGGEEGIPLLPRLNSAPIRRTEPFLVICRCFRAVTSVAAILCIVVNVLTAVRAFKNGNEIFDGIFRCYAVLIAFFVVLAETESEYILKFWKILEYWAGRGMLQIFVAVMTRAFLDNRGEQKNLTVFQEIASYALLACGLVYVVSGLLCIGCLKRHLQQKETTREQAIKDLEDLQLRKEELETLLSRARG